jgi:glycosyltransferase involved in cell wall biosynthesis
VPETGAKPDAEAPPAALEPRGRQGPTWTTTPTPPRAAQLDGEGLAIVTEQAWELGGTERVIQSIVGNYPGATVLGPQFNSAEHPDPARIPYAERVTPVWESKGRQHFLFPIYARRMSRVEADGAKVVLSMTSHGWSATVGMPAGARHLLYYAGPSASLWTRTSYYLRSYPALARPLLRAALPLMRTYYNRLIRSADRVMANSSWVAAQFGRRHGYRPEVIHPPVRTDFFTPAERPRGHLLFVGRQVFHKRIDEVLEAFRSLGEELLVVGEGPLLERLRASAPANVRFTGFVDDAELRELYRSSRALIHPSVEEFGIVMAEAHACGTPVIAPRAGGALDIVSDGRTGLLLDRIDPESIAAAVRELGQRSFEWQDCRRSADRFSERRFIDRLDRVLVEEFERAGR